MKIAFLIRGQQSPRGAEISMQTLAAAFESDHTVRLFAFGNTEGWNPGIPLQEISEPHARSNPRIPVEVGSVYDSITEFVRVNDRLSEFDPDLLLAQHEPAYAAARYGARNDVPFVYFIRDQRLKDRQGKTRGKSSGLLSPVNRLARTGREFLEEYIVNQAAVIVSNSEYMKRQYDEQFGFESVVVYPFIQREDIEVDQTGASFVHVNPSDDKGVSVTLDVAEMLPEESVILVGNTPPEPVQARVSELSNVTYRGYVDEMSDVYRDAKIVLVPSVWEEAFGRVAVEAGVNGIPVLCSGVGGLPEAVGRDIFVVESNRPEDYVNRIQQIEREYDRYSRMARQGACKRTAPTQIQSLKDILERELGVDV